MSSSSTSATGATAAPPRAVRRAALVAHGRPEVLGDAVARVRRCAAAAGVELFDGECADPDLIVALGGDGTMLRALRGCLAAPAPVFGVNFGRVGFLTSIRGSELDQGLARVFAGDFKVVELCTLAVRFDDGPEVAVNDVVVTSSQPGRMVELEWEIGGEALGRQPCDGLICSTPTGSTAYNLSSGGPVLMWGLDAMAITFVAPHSLQARPLVVPRGLGLRVTNRTPDVPVSVLVDGHAVAELAAGEPAEVGLGMDTSLLALLPEVTFFTRYHDIFT